MSYPPTGKRHGGASRKNRPNKSKADLAAVINKIISQEERMGLAAELARGVTVEETDKKGEVKIYTKPPDIAALKFLEEYATGKPIQRFEHGGIDDDSIQVTLVRVTAK